MASYEEWAAFKVSPDGDLLKKRIEVGAEDYATQILNGTVNNPGNDLIVWAVSVGENAVQTAEEYLGLIIGENIGLTTQQLIDRIDADLLADIATVTENFATGKAAKASSRAVAK